MKKTTISLRNEPCIAIATDTELEEYVKPAIEAVELDTLDTLYTLQ